MSNKSSPRRRSVATKRYDEDYEYYAPTVRNYGKSKNESSTAEESETPETPEIKRKRGRPPGSRKIFIFTYSYIMLTTLYPFIFQGSKVNKTPESETKRVGRPRRYTASASQEDSPAVEENKPMEVNILSIMSDPTAEPEAEMTTEEPAKEESPPQQKEKVELGQVLELAVQSMSVSMEEEDIELSKDNNIPEIDQNSVEAPKETNSSISKFTHHQQAKQTTHQIKISYESAEEQDSDFEWKLENEEDSPVSHSPPAKKKKMLSTNAAAVVVPTVSFFFPV